MKAYNQGFLHLGMVFKEPQGVLISYMGICNSFIYAVYSDHDHALKADDFSATIANFMLD